MAACTNLMCCVSIDFNKTIVGVLSAGTAKRTNFRGIFIHSHNICNTFP